MCPANVVPVGCWPLGRNNPGLEKQSLHTLKSWSLTALKEPLGLSRETTAVCLEGKSGTQTSSTSQRAGKERDLFPAKIQGRKLPSALKDRPKDLKI